MKKIIKLTERDLEKIVKQVIIESENQVFKYRDVPPNNLRKLEKELINNGIDAKISGLMNDFIEVRKPGEDLQITVNSDGRYVIQPRRARSKDDQVLFVSVPKHNGTFEDNLEVGIRSVLSFFKFANKKGEGRMPEGGRFMHKKFD